MKVELENPATHTQQVYTHLLVLILECEQDSAAKVFQTSALCLARTGKTLAEWIAAQGEHYDPVDVALELYSTLYD